MYGGGSKGIMGVVSRMSICVFRTKPEADFSVGTAADHGGEVVGVIPYAMQFVPSI